ESGRTLLGAATESFGDSGDPFREQHFTRAACAELLIDAGAVVDPPICKGVLPRTLMTLVALGDLDGVRACFDESGALRAGPGNADARAAVNEAFMCA